MDKLNSHVCPISFCRMETETVQHICCCEALARQRYNCLWEADCRTKGHKHSLNKGPLPLHTRRRVIEAVLNDILGLHNKPKAAVNSVNKLTGPKKKKKKKKKNVLYLHGTGASNFILTCLRAGFEFSLRHKNRESLATTRCAHDLISLQSNRRYLFLMLFCSFLLKMYNILYPGDRGGIVVKVLCYKSEGR